MHTLLQELQNKQIVWRAADTPQKQAPTPSGYAALDEALNGGFPQAGSIHLQSHMGIGELRLILPAIAAKKTNDLCVFIAPPMPLNAEFLLAQGLRLEQVLLLNTSSSEEALWSAEQCAKSGACSAVFIWQAHLLPTHAKKLELAALKGACLCVILSPERTGEQALPVSLSMHLHRQHDNLQIKVNKQKVGWPMPAFPVPLPFAAKMGSPLRRQRHWPSTSARTNVYALHAKA